jgi:nicotinamidase-related amidase
VKTTWVRAAIASRHYYGLGSRRPERSVDAENREDRTEAKFVARKGEASAWDVPAFPEAVRATGKHTLLIAGVWTSVWVVFPALAARAEGYSVYAVIDASKGAKSDIRTAGLGPRRAAEQRIRVESSHLFLAV